MKAISAKTSISERRLYKAAFLSVLFLVLFWSAHQSQAAESYSISLSGSATQAGITNPATDVNTTSAIGIATTILQTQVPAAATPTTCGPWGYCWSGGTTNGDSSVAEARASADTSGLHTFADAHFLDVKNPDGYTTSAASASATASMTIDDLTITPIAGVTSNTVTGDLFLHVSGDFLRQTNWVGMSATATTTVSGTLIDSSTGSVQAFSGSITVTCIDQGTCTSSAAGFLAGSAPVLTGFYPGVPRSGSINGTFNVGTFTLPVGNPIILSITMTNVASADTGPGPLHTFFGEPISGVSQTDFSNTTKFPVTGAIFNLPAGFTANSAQAGIHNNRLAGANAAPIANAGNDQTVFFGQAVTMDGVASSDSDGDPLTYVWALNSAPAGSLAALTASNTANPTLLPDVVGQYLISLVVNDGIASSVADSIMVTVAQNLPPVASLMAMPLSGLAPLTVQFDALASSDAENSTLNFQWDFGDLSSGINNSSAAVNPLYTYQQPGTYTVLVTVTDAVGNTDQAAATVIVTAPNQPPVVAPVATPSSSVAPAMIIFNSHANDPNGDPLSIQWDFGDGSTSYEADITHVYTVPGTYIATVAVNDGQYSTRQSITISIGSALFVQIEELKIERGDDGEVEGEIDLEARYSLVSPIASNDQIRVTVNGAVLFDEPFNQFKEKKGKSGVYRYKERGLHAKVDVNKAKIEISRHQMNIPAVDNIASANVVVSIGQATASVHVDLSLDESEAFFKDDKDDDSDDDD